MNPRNLILILLAITGVVLVVMLTRSFLSGAQQETRVVQSAPVSDTKILVAKRNLHVGSILKPEDVTWQPWPQAGVSDAYYLSGKDKIKAVAGKVVRLPLAKGEPMTRSALVEQGERGFLAAILTPGMRAVTIKLSPTSGIGGFVFPGDRVDVILTHALELSRTEVYQIAETVFQNVRVLAVDQRSDADDKVKVAKTATIEVTPKMAEKVAMLDRLGGLSLSLRSLARTAENEPLADPASPPLTTSATHTMGNEVSRFLPALDDTTSSAVRVSRGNIVSLVSVSQSKPATLVGSDEGAR